MSPGCIREWATFSSVKMKYSNSVTSNEKIRNVYDLIYVEQYFLINESPNNSFKLSPASSNPVHTILLVA